MQKGKLPPPSESLVFKLFFPFIAVLARFLTALLLPIIFLVMAIVVPLCLAVEIAFCALRNQTGVWLAKQMAQNETPEQKAARLMREIMREDS